MNLRPSSLPMLAACPCFESRETEWTEPGTNRHKLFAARIANKLNQLDDFYLEDLAAQFDESDIEACEWASDYFLLKAPLADYPWQSERKMSFMLPDFTEMEGTPDAVCGNHLFDLKSRERDYSSQMAAYALMIFEAHPEFPSVTVHVMYAITKRIDCYTVTKDEALEIVQKVIINAFYWNGEAENQFPKPRACDYCGWCKKVARCPAVASRVEQAAKGYADKFPEIDISNWHPSQMTSAEEIALALTIWRCILKKWGESVEFHALEAATKLGLSLPGFKLTEREGKISCTDVVAAFQLSGLPQSDFMKCCDLRMNRSKTYPDREGLVNAYAAANGLKPTPAKRDLTTKLSSVLTRGNSAPRLVVVKGDDEETE